MSDEIPRLENVAHLRTTYNVDLKEPEWIFKDFMRKGDQVLLSGRTGEGKSLVTLLMCVAIARGTTFGFLECVKPRNILYLDAENDAYLIQLRIRRLETNEGLEFIKYWRGAEDPTYTLDLTNEQDQQIILKYVKENDIDLVVFDNVFTLTQFEDYMTTKEYQQYVKPLVLELKKRKVTGIYIHHLNKRDEEYGSIGMKLFMDICIKLTKKLDDETKYFNLEVSKSRGFGINDENLNFMITDDNEVIPYVVEIEEGGKQHYLTFLKNNWHTVEGGKRKKISGLTAKFEADFNCEAPISENTVRNYHAKDWK